MSGAQDRPTDDMSKRMEHVWQVNKVFALAMMTNPQMAQNVGNWMQQFGDSNQGMEFNRARMMKAGINPEGIEGVDVIRFAGNASSGLKG